MRHAPPERAGPPPRTGINDTSSSPATNTIASERLLGLQDVFPAIVLRVPRLFKEAVIADLKDT